MQVSPWKKKASIEIPGPLGKMEKSFSSNFFHSKLIKKLWKTRVVTVSGEVKGRSPWVKVNKKSISLLIIIPSRGE